MRKLLLPLLIFASVAIYSQKSEMFNAMSAVKYESGEWIDIPQDRGIDYIVTLDLKNHTLLITRSKDNLNMHFIQVMAFLDTSGKYIITALLVDENSNTFPICGYLYNEALEINFGQLVYLFHKEEYSGKL